MSRTLDNFYAFKFVNLLTKDWKDTDAYELGIIDENGKVIKKTLTGKERREYTRFDRLVFNIRRMLEKLPLGKSTIARYSLALKLLKEEMGEEEFGVLMEELEENSTAGMDIPQVNKKKDKFADCKVFDVDSDIFEKCRLGKTKYARYKTYVGDDEIGEMIRDYGYKNPGKDIILRDSKNGAMLYFKRYSK